MSQILSFCYSPSGDFVFADEIRCAAYEYAKSQGERGVCLLLVSLPSQAASVQVVANLNAGEASIVLPVPEWTEEHSFGQVFSFSGVNYVISDNDRMPKEQEVFSMLKADRPLFLYSLDRSSASITGVQYHPGDQTGTPAERSAEAAAAAALVLHKELQNGTMESTIDQPGGILEIGLRKENGKLLGLSAGGPVEVRK